MIFSPLKTLGVALLASTFASTSHAAPKASYHLAATWKLAGDSYWDYLTLDPTAHRLYIARGTRIEVLDTNSGKLVGAVTGIHGAHGVALDFPLGRGYATSGRDNRVVPFSLKTLKPAGAPISVGDRPDAITLEPVTGHIFAWNAGGNSTSIIEPKTGRVLKTIALGSNPEFAVADGLGQIFVNLEGSSEIVKIDAKTNKIVSRHPLAPGEEPSGLAYDAQKKVLFSGCANNTMMVWDAKNDKALAHLPIGAGVDATTFDPQLGLAFSSNGEDGTTSVIGRNVKGQYAVVNTLHTHVGARTMALNSKTHDLYFIAADYEPMAPGVTEGEGHWPKMVPGSAVVLKFAHDK